MNEAHILKNLRHPNIPIIYDIEEDDNYIYIVEEYVEGQSLRTIRFVQSYIQESKIVDYLLQLCDVLNFLHSKEHSILYLDLKPENIIVFQGIVKLIDFGTAVFTENVRTRKQSFGTRGYAAPEQYGLKTVDRRSDIYGLGGAIYFLITGKIYDGTKEGWKELDQNHYCSKKLKKIVKKCLRCLPIQRYQSVMELKKQLELVLKREDTVNRQEKTPHRIAVAGSIPRIGTTHICLMITAYLNQKGISALFIEANEKRVIESLRTHRWVKESFPMVRGTMSDMMERYKEYQVFICDYGTMTPEKLETEEAEQRLFVMGSKPWEEKIQGTASEIEYLFNFTKSTDFFMLSKHYKDYKCHKVPFESDFLCPFDRSIIKEFMEEILGDLS